jgi:hypothetical protein
MIDTISLTDVPDRFLDRDSWNDLLKFAGSKLNALTLLNAPLPVDENDIFWGIATSINEKHERFNLFQKARALTSSCRMQLLEGSLVAFGFLNESPDRVRIPQDRWAHLWPMFATERAVFRDLEFIDLRIASSESLMTSAAKLHDELVAWLQTIRTAKSLSKKQTLREDAIAKFGQVVTTRDFDIAYKSVFGGKRGRPFAK